MRYLCLYAIVFVLYAAGPPTADVAGALPDFSKTPGAVNPRIGKLEICTPGFLNSQIDLGTTRKHRVLKNYDRSITEIAKVEIDLLVPFALGGSNAEENLWPQDLAPAPAAAEKNLLEAWLVTQVCQNRVDLAEAQRLIAIDWTKLYQMMLTQKEFPAKPGSKKSKAKKKR